MEALDPAPAGRLSVGELARLAGVTPRAIRHYHEIGVVPEPARDSSGYRRYGPRDVIAAVRVVRLRALGMPLQRIAAHVAEPDGALPLAASLRTLADELDGEIARLTQTRDRLRALAGSDTLDDPAETLAAALRGLGLHPAAIELPDSEASAARLVDALHPQGLPGALEQADALLRDPEARRRLGAAIQRFRALGEESTGAEIEALAADVATVLPRPVQAARPVGLDVMDKLVGDRLNQAQRSFMRRLRQKLAEA
jgi:DNA-binding transcriptional MerR regulator